jgi:hypothetical protein
MEVIMMAETKEMEDGVLQTLGETDIDSAIHVKMDLSLIFDGIGPIGLRHIANKIAELILKHADDLIPKYDRSEIIGVKVCFNKNDAYGEEPKDIPVVPSKYSISFDAVNWDQYTANHTTYVPNPDIRRMFEAYFGDYLERRPIAPVLNHLDIAEVVPPNVLETEDENPF